MSDGNDLVEMVRIGARLDSRSEAEDVIRGVTGGMADQLHPEAWQLITKVIPPEVRQREAPERRSGIPSVNALFEDVGERLDLGPPTAARYVRVVAEAINRGLEASDRQRLQEVLEDEFLALFEVDHRGELTEDDGATPAARIREETEES